MAYGPTKSPGPKFDVSLSEYLPYRSSLRDGTPVVLQRLVLPVDPAVTDKHYQQQVALLTQRGELISDGAACDSVMRLLNYEIEQGNTYPFSETFSYDRFVEYFFGYDTFVLRSLRPSGSTEVPLHLQDPTVVGCFFIKPNFPGRSAHVCNGGFLVAPAYRRRGAGLLLGERFRLLAKALGYQSSLFNLVYHDNIASLRLWSQLSFTRIGVVPGAGWHPVVAGQSRPGDPHHYVDASMWYLDLTQPLQSIPMPWKVNRRGDVPSMKGKL